MKTMLVSVLLWVALTAAGTAHAHQQHGEVTLTDLTRNSVMIVEGEVDEVTAQWNAARTQIHTTVRVFVTGYHKGGDGRELLEFRMLGGTVHDETLAIIGQPTFSVGESVVLFFHPHWEHADAPIVEMEHGKLTLKPGPGREMLVSGAGESYVKSEVVERIRKVNAAGREAKP